MSPFSESSIVIQKLMSSESGLWEHLEESVTKIVNLSDFKENEGDKRSYTFEVHTAKSVISAKVSASWDFMELKEISFTFSKVS